MTFIYFDSAVKKRRKPLIERKSAVGTESLYIALCPRSGKRMLAKLQRKYPDAVMSASVKSRSGAREQSEPEVDAELMKRCFLRLIAKNPGLKAGIVWDGDGELVREATRLAGEVRVLDKKGGFPTELSEELLDEIGQTCIVTDSADGLAGCSVCFARESEPLPVPFTVGPDRYAPDRSSIILPEKLRSEIPYGVAFYDFLCAFFGETGRLPQGCYATRLTDGTGTVYI